MSLAADVRWSARTMRRNPVTTLVAGVSLAVAIAANTAAFSVVHAFLLRPLGLAEADRLVRVRESFRPGAGHAEVQSLTATTFHRWRKASSEIFAGMAAGTGRSLVLSGTGAPEQLDAAAVSADFFDVLGLRPALGRAFVEAEDTPGGPRAVVLGHELWRGRFGGSTHVLGRAVVLDGEPHTVVGVMPRGVSHPYQARAWVPLRLRDDPRDGWGYYVPARLRPGVTRERAEAHLSALARRVRDDLPADAAPDGARLTPLRDEMTGDLDRVVTLLQAGAAFVLLLACSNAAGLFLAQGIRLQAQMGVRRALGAARARLVRSALVHSGLVALLACALGTALAGVGIGPLLALSPAHALGEFDIEPRLDLPVLAFSVGVSLAAGLAFGLLPALRASAVAPAVVLERRRAGGPELRAARLLSGLVVAQVALATLLLVVGALTLRSLAKVMAEDRGYRVRGVLTFELTPSPRRYREPAERAELVRRTLEAVRRLPDVLTVGASSVEPLFPGTFSAAFRPRDAAGRSDRPLRAHVRAVTPGYFDALGIPLLQGRDFRDTDVSGAPTVAVVSRTFAERAWPGENPLGQRFAIGTADAPEGEATVVGVGRTLRETEDDAVPTSDAVYLSYAQPETAGFEWMVFTARVRGEPHRVAAAARQAVAAVDPLQPIRAVSTMEGRLRTRTASDRLRAWLHAWMACIGLLLALAGVYGVLSFSVNRRLHELGLRSALGATPGELRRLVLRHSLSLTAAGLALGTVGAMAAARVVASELHGVEAGDPVAFAAAAAVIAAGALLASWLPARRAVRADPMTALRAE